MVLNKIKEYGRLVMFSHSIFSLPFALIAMIWAAQGLPSIMVFVWILVALLGARNGANAFNRIADVAIDKKNPRTSGRHLPSGKLKMIEAYVITIFCFAIMSFAAFQLNIICFMLLPFAILLFIVYSYSKRFTWLCHVILGIACGAAPMGAWLAVSAPLTVTPFILWAAVCFWVAGFDIIYATQDIDFDRKEGVYSIPSRFGYKDALSIAAFFHVLSVFLLITVFFFQNVGIIYIMGIAIIALLLIYEHRNISPNNSRKMNFVSYHINQIVGVVFFIFAIADFVFLGLS